MDELAPDPRLLEKFGRKFQAGDVIFREGEAGNEAFLLQEGRVRLLKRVRTVERSLMVLKPGDLFGESALMPGSTFPNRVAGRVTSTRSGLICAMRSAGRASGDEGATRRRPSTRAPRVTWTSLVRRANDCAKPTAARA